MRSQKTIRVLMLDAWGLLMKKLLFVTCFSIMALFAASCQAHAWQPSAGHKQIPIWPQGKMPDAKAITKPEETRIIKKPLADGCH